MPSAGHGTDMDSTKMNDNPFSAPSIDENRPKQIPKLLVPKWSVGLKTFDSCDMFWWFLLIKLQIMSFWIKSQCLRMSPLNSGLFGSHQARALTLGNSDFKHLYKQYGLPQLPPTFWLRSCNGKKIKFEQCSFKKSESSIHKFVQPASEARK